MNRDVEVFADAVALPAAERGAFLDRVCAGDTALRAHVEVLLQAHNEATGFLEKPLTTRATTAPEEKPGDRIGHYQLLEKIGEGGCGVVYVAEQKEPIRRRP